MRMPDWRNSIFEEGVLPEPIADRDRIVLWLPDDRDERFRYWERVGNVARATITAGEGLCATAATSIRARQKIRGPLGKLFSRLRGTTGDRTLMLPDGETVEAWGGRRTDLLLVWAEDEDDARPLDEARIRSRWPESQRIRELGKNLFLVSGIEPRPAKTEAVPEPVPPQGNPLQVAEQLLVAARATGDRREEVSALADLGLIHREQGDAPRAVVLLEEAAALARQLGDRARECDVLGNLGLATLAVGQPSRARQILESELAMAREAGDRFAEKVALNNLGLADSSLGDPVRAIAAFEGALALAHAVGDRHHEAELLWYLAIQQAGLGRRGPAIARARAAVDLLERMGRPEAAWFADHLRRYQGGDPADRLGGAGTAEVPGRAFGGSIDAGAMAARAGPSTVPGPTEPGPGLLVMALSATKAMARFLGSGMKTATPELRQARLGTCAACEHHTGLRCRICGCFTEAKARMLHEECPLGKWPVSHE